MVESLVSSKLLRKRRPPRNLDGSAIVHVTLRTFQQRFLFTPQSELNQILGGVLARYQEQHGVEIFAYIFLSNHIHLALRCPKANLDQFMQDLGREIARRTNDYWKRNGVVFARRYADQKVLDENADALQLLLYILTNATRHGLVRDPNCWPGLTCYHQLVGAKDPVYRFFHATEYSEAMRRSNGKVRREDFYTSHTLRLTPIPLFTGMSHAEMLKTLMPLLEERTNKLHSERALAKQGYLGSKAVRMQHHEAQPLSSNSSPKPLAYTKNPHLYKQFRREHQIRVAKYRAASIALRKGSIDALLDFPDFCRYPALHTPPPALAASLKNCACCERVNLLGSPGCGPRRPKGANRTY